VKVVLLDYDAGNTQSVILAFRRLGLEVILSASPEEISTADKVIVPGVGAAGSAMQRLHVTGLSKVIQNLTQPVLGICLGMQLFCRSSEEGPVDCLQIIDTAVMAFPADSGKVPLTGWNSLDKVQGPLFKGIDSGTYFYFVHGYYVPETNATVASARFGGLNPATATPREAGLTYSAALQQDNFFAVQFHPERSGPAGVRLLQNFLQI